MKPFLDTCMLTKVIVLNLRIASLSEVQWKNPRKWRVCRNHYDLWKIALNKPVEYISLIANFWVLSQTRNFSKFESIKIDTSIVVKRYLRQSRIFIVPSPRLNIFKVTFTSWNLKLNLGLKAVDLRYIQRKRKSHTARINIAN